MDLSKLTLGDKIMAGSGLALLLFSFFPWFGIDGFDGGRSAWDNFFSLVAVLIAVVIVGLIAVARFTTTSLPQIPMGMNKLVFFGSIAVVVLILLQLLIGDEVVGIDLDRKFGIYLGLIAAAGLAYGGFVKSKEPEMSTGAV